MELIQTALQISDQGITRLVEDMGDAPLTFPTPRQESSAVGDRPRRLRRGQHPKTAGQTFMVIAMHHMSHRGQVADARRAAGRKPMFTPRMY